jgi:hypothetical protein
MKNRNASGISAPNKVSNIAPPLRPRAAPKLRIPEADNRESPKG